MKSKPIQIRMPTVLISQLETICEAEGRNLSDLMRESARQYVERFEQRQHKKEMANARQ